MLVCIPFTWPTEGAEGAALPKQQYFQVKHLLHYLVLLFRQLL